MNKRQLERLEKKNQRLLRKEEQDIKKAISNGQKKLARLIKRAERNRINRQTQSIQTEKTRKIALTHTQKIEANREKRALDRLFGVKPPLKRKPKKHPSEFRGYYYVAKRNKYRVRFTFNKKTYRLGEYDTPEIAHNVYLAERAKVVAKYEAKTV